MQAIAFFAGKVPGSPGDLGIGAAGGADAGKVCQRRAEGRKRLPDDRQDQHQNDDGIADRDKWSENRVFQIGQRQKGCSRSDAERAVDEGGAGFGLQDGAAHAGFPVGTVKVECKAKADADDDDRVDRDRTKHQFRDNASGKEGPDFRDGDKGCEDQHADEDEAPEGDIEHLVEIVSPGSGACRWQSNPCPDTSGRNGGDES